MAKELKIEVGKRYRTFSGKEVRVYATDGEGDFPVHGALLERIGWEVQTWTIQGCYLYGDPNGNLNIKEEIK